MKRPVSLVASLVLALPLIGACGGGAPGKTQFAEVCTAKMGSADKCTCFIDSLEKELTPELFAKVATGVEDNKRFAGLMPPNLSSDPVTAGAIDTASQACLN